MKKQDRGVLEWFVVIWAFPILVVVAMVSSLNSLTFSFLPSLKENLYFQSYLHALNSVFLLGSRLLLACILIPTIFGTCDLVPKIFAMKFLWRRWLKRELETERGFVEAVQNKWWRKLAFATPLYGILAYQYRDQLIEMGRIGGSAETVICPPDHQCDVQNAPEQCRSESSAITIITLSDHTATLLNEAEESRRAAYLADLEQYDLARKYLQHGREVAGETLRSAWRERGIWGKIRGLLDWRRAMRAVPPTAPRLQNAGDREQIWIAGNEGEELVLNELKRRLTGTWTVLKGYLNHKGEIDLVAVGPSGIVAMEVKNVSGVVHCNGDEWNRDKYDNFGNLVQGGVPIKDKGGRAPSRQLNEAADALQYFLQRRGMSANILRVVVLAHNSSKIGSVRNQTVDWICTLPDLDLAMFCRGRCTENSTAEIEKAVSLIRQDHAYDKKRRQR